MQNPHPIVRVIVDRRFEGLCNYFIFKYIILRAISFPSVSHFKPRVRPSPSCYLPAYLRASKTVSTVIPCYRYLDGGSSVVCENVLRRWVMASCKFEKMSCLMDDSCVYFLLQPRRQGFMRKRFVLERRKAFMSIKLPCIIIIIIWLQPDTIL
jgi:hypothetical protein